MIIALLLAAQAAAPAGYTPAEEQALTATLVCQKRYFDSLPRRERRRRGEALIDESHAACAKEDAALRDLLRTRFDEAAAERALRMVRDTLRGGLLQYIRR